MQVKQCNRSDVAKISLIYSYNFRSWTHWLIILYTTYAITNYKTHIHPSNVFAAIQLHVTCTNFARIFRRPRPPFSKNN